MYLTLPFIFKMLVHVRNEELVKGTKYKITDFNLVGEYDKYYGVFKGFSTWDGIYLKFRKRKIRNLD